ncbi:MAG: hypothetical protein KF893_00460 [Caldilineaceae bacterium]|nr:hypothetical protein [Caldilineaceae bacterium]
MNENGTYLNGTPLIGEKATIYPTLVVGVGGMGTNTVRAVKRRLRKVWGGDTLPGMVQLLALDTEPLVNRLDQEPLYADEFAYMGKFDATRLVDNLDNHPEIARWWNYPSIPLGYIHNGAKQLRPIGRLSFFRNYVTFKRLLETKYASLDKIRDMEMAQNRGFPVMGNYQLVYVVGSLCGGTGSGMFMDVAHRVRALVRSNARVVGIFYLPDVLEEEITSDLQRRRIKANAYAALKELNYFQETQTFQELYPSEQRALPDTPYAPFDFIFLVGRTNREGRSLARKSDAENLAAHLIQLTAISHLSSEILGLEVNVVRERMANPNLPAGEVVGERRTKSGHFLVYSSFAASAIVAPDELLTQFWQRAFLTDVIRRFAAGPSLQDPRQPISTSERQRVMTIWQTLLAEMRSRYLALNNDRLEEIIAEIEEGRGAWLSFRELAERAFRQAIVETGLRGAIALSELIGPNNPAAAPMESLHRQRLFLLDNQPVGEEDRARWRSLLAQEGGAGERVNQLAGGFGDLLLSAFSPRQARERARDLATRKARARLYQRRDATERMMVDELGHFATRMREVFRNQLTNAAQALVRANNEASAMADRIDPRIPDGTLTTSTYYELETGAIGRDYLQHFYKRAAGAVHAEDWQMLLGRLLDGLLTQSNPLSAEQMLEILNTSVYEDTGLIGRVRKLVDIRHIIGVQHGEEVSASRPLPNNRIHQWLDRLNPYIRWDSDRFSFHDADLEHIRLAATPGSRADDQDMAIAMVGQEDIKWVPTGDVSRMDAVWIVHGLPVTLLERLDEFRAQYENMQDFPVTEEFHLNPHWVNLPEITPEMPPSHVSNTRITGTNYQNWSSSGRR